MVFNSFDFFFFFLLVFSVHWTLRPRARNAFLLAASYAFYALWDWRYVPLLFLITSSSYLCCAGIRGARSPRARRLCVAVAVISHVGLLTLYKLLNSFAGWDFPVGLSFYSFQSLGCVIDVYRGDPLAADAMEHGLFLSFFPQLLSGPIARAKNLLPQIKSPRTFEWQRFQDGCHLIYWGLFQKVFMADNLALSTGRILDRSPFPARSEILLGIYGFAVQLYCDFSGYSDMARGLGKCLGFELTQNFDAPFFATDVLDFWKRWHMSLTSWFTDYVYRPLVDLPFGFYKLYTAPLATLVLMGLWHKAGATMVLMGLYFGLLAVLTLLVRSPWPAGADDARRNDAPGAALLPWLQRALTFNLFCGGLILFRADSPVQAFSVFRRVASGPAWSRGTLQAAEELAFFGGPLILVQCLQYAKGEPLAVARLHPVLRSLIYAAMFFAILIFGNDGSHEFIYFQF